ncbi:MAG: hypothetical protein IJH37_00455 [Clostridia bacterium]|nr:hypothetical protein [Clostridia bacterium]
MCVSDGHGAYPHHSWAGGAREDLDFYLEFGTDTEVKKVVFFLRTDFPHDTYWKSLDVKFSDGTVKTMNLEKTAKGQALCLDVPLVTKSIHLTDFKQASYPLSWAALSQIEVYGRYLK